MNTVLQSYQHKTLQKILLWKKSHVMCISICNHQIVASFTGANYEFWNVKIKFVLISINLWDLGGKGVEENTEIQMLQTVARQMRRKQKRRKLKATCRRRKRRKSSNIKCHRTPTISCHWCHLSWNWDYNTCKTCMDTLQKYIQGSTKVHAIKLQTVRRKFEDLSVRIRENITDYFSIITGAVNQMEIYREEILEAKVAFNILNSLTNWT